MELWRDAVDMGLFRPTVRMHVTTAVVLFTRDLRVHDNPALVAACRRADEVVPLFVFDDEVLRGRFASPNRAVALHVALRGLAREIEARGGRLHLATGDPIAQAAAAARRAGADEIHLAGDVSAHARRRVTGLRRAVDAGDAGRARPRVVEHPGVTVVPAGALVPSGSDHYRVFTPYFRRWRTECWREPTRAPARIPTPPGFGGQPLPGIGDLTDDVPARGLVVDDESGARRRLARHLAALDRPELRRDEPGADATSRLSAALHLGVVSAAEFAHLLAEQPEATDGHEAVLRQLCWRDFNHQLLAARPDIPTTALRSDTRVWRDDADAFDAWRQGHTGYPIVDAGMRQLLEEGWMHNRARLLAASFLTKHLGVDWRLGAAHFLRHLVDGDLANNSAQWQWAAGVGVDTRPGRFPNPVAQARRLDPDGAYVRRFVPELSDVSGGAVHAPWEFGGRDGYPAPLVDHGQAREEFARMRAAARR